ncbi:MAG TPA: carbamoyltransferase HypF [Vicinamibacterales bacterium]|jgi:hydrogenase maturation protein HypF|nr:carbamoyltransferase HypF [Vicinamibacterales bacterium]
MSVAGGTARLARRVRIRGVVQGVGFRPHVFRVASAHGLDGWVLNAGDGVHVHVEGSERAIDAFLRDLRSNPPPAARIETFDVEPAHEETASGFEIRRSVSTGKPTTRIAADLPMCDDCRRELFDPSNRRYLYPYINCTNCGPRYSIARRLPYDRPATTMAAWPMCEACASEYHDPRNRRFHAQPVACPTCGPNYRLLAGRAPLARGDDAIRLAAMFLTEGQILAVKGIGGYHLACDAGNADAVEALRERKYRKERPFALMVRDETVADRTVHLSDDERALLTSPARPIVLAAARVTIAGVAPDNREIGVMLPYAPLHHLLFDAGAPDRLVMTSGNHSSEPIAYQDEEAFRRLDPLADAILVGERPIARRVDDSVVRATGRGAVVLRRSRGYSPGTVAVLPQGPPLLAVGADLKNAIALVVEGQAYVSQHIGDLIHHQAGQAFDETIRDLLSMYEVDRKDMIVAHDSHPEYASTARAMELGAGRIVAVQHHRAHIASVLAERGAFDERVVGVAFDGTGYGDDGTIWGGEFFVGSLAEGFTRHAHLRPALLPGGDAAAQFPVQAAAGFLRGMDAGLPDLSDAPFRFPARYEDARALLRTGVRVFQTTSVGRLFDTVAALLGYTRPITFEGQAAIWLEQRAQAAERSDLTLPCTFAEGEIDWRPTLAAVIEWRRCGQSPELIARAFHRGLARATAAAVVALAEREAVKTVVLSGGVMQNTRLVADVVRALEPAALRVWMNNRVPPNDGGICLGQAAIARFAQR